MFTLYDFLESGNGYKVRLTLHLLGLDYRLIEKNILKGETRSEEFLKINPVGKIPAIQIEDGRILFESNAILTYLARNTALMPEDDFAQAQVMSWLFFEQYSHEPNIAVLRFWRHYIEMTDEQKKRVPEKEKAGYEALDILEMGVKYSPSGWLVGNDVSIADIALFAYTHVAEEGGFELDRYPAIQDWIKRIEALDGYKPITYRHIAA
ncbi:glutathione S-transferase family protein [Curvivirga sp.]|uniref:glutathione S-transferase family protein n=1 Tax=Curvivirga sp. TaxID=2856848 RepID=UPI003B59644F